MPTRSAEHPGAEMKPVWNVPHRRNAHFTGREGVLELVGRALNGSEPAERVQVLHGLGGIGKTQVALEFAYRHRDDYDLVWWLSAADPAALSLGLATVVRALGAAPPADASADELRGMLETKLRQVPRWLIV